MGDPVIHKIKNSLLPSSSGGLWTWFQKMSEKFKDNRIRANDQAAELTVAANLPEAARVEILYFTDPFCIRSWALEPVILKLKTTYKNQIQIRPVLPGHKLTELANLHGAGEFSGLDADELKRMYPSGHLALCWRRADKISPQPISDFFLRINPNPFWSTHRACRAARAAFDLNFEMGEQLLREMRIFACAKGLCLSAKIIKTLVASIENFDATAFEEKNKGEPAARLEEHAQKLFEKFNPIRYPMLVFRTRRDFAVDESSGSEFVSVSGVAAFEKYRSVLNKIAPRLWEFQTPDVLDALHQYKTLTSAELAAVCDYPPKKIEENLCRLESRGEIQKSVGARAGFWEVSASK